jgi:Protein of unknown function (DUF1194)
MAGVITMQISRRKTLGLLTGASLGLAPAPPVRAETPDVDLLLVLAADISRSVDSVKFRLQREGYAAAIMDQRVFNAINAGPLQRIAVCFVEWSGELTQALMIDWTIISGREEAAKFAEILHTAPRRFFDRTSISGGIDFAMAQLKRAPYKTDRRVIDISGDGTHNSGRDLGAARAEALEQDVVVNGVAILSAVPLAANPGHTHPPGGLLNYYQENVIGGPGAFAVPAEGFEDFGRSIVAKLIREIAAGPSTTAA